MIQFLAVIALGAYLGICIGFFGNELITLYYLNKKEGDAHETYNGLQLVTWDDDRDGGGSGSLDSDLTGAGDDPLA